MPTRRPDALAALGELRLDLLCRVFSQLYRHTPLKCTGFTDKSKHTNVRSICVRVMSISNRHRRQSPQPAPRLQRTRNSSTCCAVFAAPRLKRTAPRASSGATPIASSVADGSVFALEHAAPRAHRVTHLVEFDHQRFAVDAREREIDWCSAGAARRRRISPRPCRQSALEPVAHCREPRREFAHAAGRNLARRAEADDRRHVFRAASAGPAPGRRR